MEVFPEHLLFFDNEIYIFTSVSKSISESIKRVVSLPRYFSEKILFFFFFNIVLALSYM